MKLIVLAVLNVVILRNVGEEVEECMSKTFSDPDKTTPLDDLPEWAVKPTTEFSIKQPSWKEIQEVEKYTRVASSPAPCGIPYKVHK